jgi:hypothetical protein
MASAFCPSGVRVENSQSNVLTAVFLLSVILLAVIASFSSMPLRRRMEANLNRDLVGYTVRIGKLDFHPIGFSLDLENSIIIQNDNPKPPVAQIGNLSASVHWRALLRGKLVADFQIDNPKFYINRRQAKKELDDKVPMKERGWQQALEEIYPLKINRFVIRNGSLTYVDEGPYRPLELSQIGLLAETLQRKWLPMSSIAGISRPWSFKRWLTADGNADCQPSLTRYSSPTSSLRNVDLTILNPRRTLRHYRAPRHGRPMATSNMAPKPSASISRK